MTLTEVVVSAAILGISTQVGLQGWASSAKSSASAALIDQQHQRLEQRLLGSRRLLQAPGVVDAACRFDVDAVDGILAALPRILRCWSGGFGIRSSQPQGCGSPCSWRRRKLILIRLMNAACCSLPLVWAIAPGRLSDINTIEGNGATWRRLRGRWFQLAGAARNSRDRWHLGHHGAGHARA